MRIIFLFLIIPFFSYSQTYDVLFIGNSYIYYNDLPNMLSNIANSFGDSISYDQSTPGGASLYAHSQDPTTINKINQQDWDYVILQDQSQRPSLSPGYVSVNVYPYAQQLVDAIELNYICSEPVFYMTWGRKYGDQSNCASYPPVCTYLGMQERLRDSYLNMGIDNDASVSPVGISFKNSIFLDSTIDLYNPDYSHPSIYGSYLAACTFYSTIFKKSSIGCSFKPNAITSAEALFLQQVASSTVLDSLATWNVFQSSFDYNVINDSVNFINSSSNFDNCLWDFGDGNQSVDINPTHTYQMNGVYDVSLSCYSNSGCLVDVFTSQVNINITSIYNIEPFKKKLLKSLDLLGREIRPGYNGVFLEFNGDGKVRKMVKVN